MTDLKKIITLTDRGNIPYAPLTVAKAVYLANGETVENATIHTYAHTKTGVVHNLTGDGANGKFKAMYAFATGDTFAINGTAYPCYSGEYLTDELIVGRWYSFIFDGEQVNFKLGGGVSLRSMLLVEW